MQKQTLTSNWNLKIDGKGDSIPATVPGSVYNDLLTDGRMEDPFYRDNEDAALKLMDHDFDYETTFTPDADLLRSDRILLHCDGLDTIADLYLNGKYLASADNMHRIWEFPLTGLLKPDANQLRIHFQSPTRFIKECFEKTVTLGSSDAMKGFPQIRKAHCMFGWDWGPRLPDAGIWKDISLIGIEKGRFDSVYITQNHQGGTVTLGIDAKVECIANGNKSERITKGSKPEPITNDTKLTYTVTVTAPDGSSITKEDSPKELTITDPKLWWPNGYGEQNLYTVRVTLYAAGAGEVLDVWERRIGLRTMTVNREKDAYGEGFAHEINGVKIFAMGADYIPEDNIYARITKERTEKLLLQCKAANFNCIRVWGGGFYPHDYFYDLCDELGLVVWQDCMFACAVYELTDAFDANIRAEIRDNVRRLRHHASLGLWCGNNEMEEFVKENQWVDRPKQKADYIKIYEYIIPQILKEEDPQTFYWPSSPSSGGSFDDPTAPERGDVHYWDVWHGDKPFSEYRKFFFRYVSEFGFQSFPALKTVESFTLPEDRNVFSYVMEKHQRNNSANGKILKYLYQTFLYPNSFDTLLYASQLLQAEAIKYGVEHFRRNRGRCMGTIYWQLNDCWPVASWASIDYFGRWKALHYFAKRFFAPVLLSCQEEGMMTQETNLNAEPHAIEQSVTFNVSNETREEKVLRLVWSVRNAAGEVLRREEQQLRVPALDTVWMDKVMLPELKNREEYVRYDLYEKGEWISGSSVILSLPKYFCYLDPKLSVRTEGDEIIVHSEAYAKSVEILNANEDLILTDNYFDMDPGERRVKICEGKPEKLRVRSVYDIR